jgi:uncharacterized membrane protein
MFCHTCGTQVGPDTQFCPNCGQSLATAPGPPGAVAISWQPPVGVHTQTGRWIGEGWQLVKADIGMFLLMALVFGLLNSMVPLIIKGPLAAGFQIFCIKKLLNRRGDFSDLFTGFNFFIPTLVASLVMSLFIFAGMLLCVIPGLVVAAMYEFTYLFIVDKRMDFWPAMQASHAVVKNDYFGFSMFLLALLGVNILGALCCLVGLLVTIPISFAAVTVAYKEVVGFDQRTLQTL